MQLRLLPLVLVAVHICAVWSQPQCPVVGDSIQALKCAYRANGARLMRCAARRVRSQKAVQLIQSKDYAIAEACLTLALKADVRRRRPRGDCQR